MLEKMQELIADQLSVDADSITEASSFKDDLGADSLDLYRRSGEYQYGRRCHQFPEGKRCRVISNAHMPGDRF